MFKKLIYILALFSLVLLVESCKKTTEACIELSETSVAVGSEIKFTSCSKNALSYEWFIEGPETAPENEQGWSDPAFSNTFTVPGNYTITLNAYANFSFLGEKSVEEKTFTVN